VLEYRNLRLYDLEKNEYDFEKISGSYDILFLDTRGTYDDTYFRNPNYEFEYQKFNIKIYRNIKLKIYNFGSIELVCSNLANFISPINFSTVHVMFNFGICYQHAHSDITISEYLGDDLLYRGIDLINNLLPLIVISRLDALKIKFLCSLFNITEINIIDDKLGCYLIEKKKIIKKAAIKKIN